MGDSPSFKELTRRAMLKALPAIVATPSIITSLKSARANPLAGGKRVVSVSWIDSEGLPALSLVDALGALVGNWPFKVMVGLVGTQNPRPPSTLPENFRTGKQFRAICGYDIGSDGAVSNEIIDPGYTPPIDKQKLPALVQLGPIPDDPNFYAGESSGLSGIVIGKLHTASTLSVPSGHEVLASALIKFRAGAHTNSVGIKDAGSPYHVPWVWCEHALIKQDDEIRLIANGSRFPSHAWYVDGKLVGSLIQKPLKLSEEEPALSSGVAAGEELGPAALDNASGPISSHPNSVSWHLDRQVALNLN